jgi:hypothetical protein
MAVSRRSSTGSVAEFNPFSPQNTYSLTDRVVLKNDRSKVAIPRFGLGVYVTMPGSETLNAVRWALEAGYRVSATALQFMTTASATWSLSCVMALSFVR